MSFAGLSVAKNSRKKRKRDDNDVAASERLTGKQVATTDQH